MMPAAAQNRAFFQQLKKYYTFYTGGFLVFLVVLAIAEQMGLPRLWIGYVVPVRHHRRCTRASAS